MQRTYNVKVIDHFGSYISERELDDFEAAVFVAVANAQHWLSEETDAQEVRISVKGE